MRAVVRNHLDRQCAVRRANRSADACRHRAKAFRPRTSQSALSWALRQRRRFVRRFGSRVNSQLHPSSDHLSHPSSWSRRQERSRQISQLSSRHSDRRPIWNPSNHRQIRTATPLDRSCPLGQPSALRTSCPRKTFGRQPTAPTAARRRRTQAERRRVRGRRHNRRGCRPPANGHRRTQRMHAGRSTATAPTLRNRTHRRNRGNHAEQYAACISHKAILAILMDRKYLHTYEPDLRPPRRSTAAQSRSDPAVRFVVPQPQQHAERGKRRVTSEAQNATGMPSHFDQELLSTTSQPLFAPTLQPATEVCSRRARPDSEATPNASHASTRSVQRTGA